MIKISKFNEILNTITGTEVQEILALTENYFREQISSSNPMKSYVVDFYNLILNSANLYQGYLAEGRNVVSSALLGEDSKAKRPKYKDVTILNNVLSTKEDRYYIYTGLLNRNFVIGYDTAKGKMQTAIYTKSLQLIEKLEKEGAFLEDDNFEKNKIALFGEGNQGYGKKVLNAFTCFADNAKKKDNKKSPAEIQELNMALALGRIDIENVVGDEVALKLTLPLFRGDYGNTLKLYPYLAFPYLSTVLSKLVSSLPEKTFSERGKTVTDIRAIKVYQQDETGGGKERFVTFYPMEYLKAVRRGSYRTMDDAEEAKELFQNQVKKIKIGWNCMKLQMHGYNLEGSLLGTAYTVIKFERLTNILNCSLKDLDTTKYMLDYDSLRRLFSVRIRAWNVAEFTEFNSICDTSECANREERIQRIENWVYNIEDADLYNIMKKIKPNLFVVKDEQGNVVKDLDRGLDDTYNRKPYAAKHLRVVDLKSNMNERLIQVKELLRNGLCKIESVSTRAGSNRVYWATNNDSILSVAYRPNQLVEFESDKKSLDSIYDMIQKDKIKTYDNFVNKLMIAKVDGLVNYGSLDENSTKQDWLYAIEDARVALMGGSNAASEKRKATNPYLVNFKRLYADSADKFHGSVDVRNIESIEYGTQRK